MNLLFLFRLEVESVEHLQLARTGIINLSDYHISSFPETPTAAYFYRIMRKQFYSLFIYCVIKLYIHQHIVLSFIIFHMMKKRNILKQKHSSFICLKLNQRASKWKLTWNVLYVKKIICIGMFSNMMKKRIFPKKQSKWKF